MCLLCAYTTRMVSGWPMMRGQPAIVDGASVGESAAFELCERAQRGTLTPAPALAGYDICFVNYAWLS